MSVSNLSTIPFSATDSSSSDSDVEIELGKYEAVANENSNGNLKTDLAACPASPLTLPYIPKNEQTGPQCSIRHSRRNRTTSISKSTKSTAAESMIRRNSKTIYTAGRPPWYNSAGQHIEPFVIGICGGSASGKTTVATKVIEALDVPWVTLLSMDSFYKVLNEKQKEMSRRNEYNFDHPDAFDFELLLKTLQRLKKCKKVDVPIYNFVTHSRETRTKTMYGANVIIFEGILTFHNKEVLSMLDLKVFVDTDADIRLARRLKRDISERGRDLDGILKQYETMVQPSFDFYIQPTVRYADLIVPRGGENEVAIQLIVQNIHAQLQMRGLKLREQLANSSNGTKMPSSLHCLPSTPQIKGIHTFIRSRHTPRDEFIFYSDRLIRLVLEFSMTLLPFDDKTIDLYPPHHASNSTNSVNSISYKGKTLSNKKIFGVSILRAGEAMEKALYDVCKDIRIGKILIQTNVQTGEPELYYLRLPKDIKDYNVILMDATVATGSSAMMAIRVLLDHDVPESNIYFVSLLMAEAGVFSIAYAFPQVHIVTTAVDPGVNDKYYVIPGIGNFGDRYFGTEPQISENES